MVTPRYADRGNDKVAIIFNQELFIYGYFQSFTMDYALDDIWKLDNSAVINDCCSLVPAVNRMLFDYLLSQGNILFYFAISSAPLIFGDTEVTSTTCLKHELIDPKAISDIKKLKGCHKGNTSQLYGLINMDQIIIQTNLAFIKYSYFTPPRRTNFNIGVDSLPIKSEPLQPYSSALFLSYSSRKEILANCRLKADYLSTFPEASFFNPRPRSDFQSTQL
jgi:hypothetical protein